MNNYSPGGYSWLCIASEPKRRRSSLSKTQKRALERTSKKMDAALSALETKIERYHTLCEKYEDVARGKRGETILKQLDQLQEDGAVLTKRLLELLDEASNHFYEK
ncbi:MAG: hypothetical protein KR126chlam2_00297 [Chlamydiae bacterium]|nr:hypothetical protein [Chlamydiota bacterium]